MVRLKLRWLSVSATCLKSKDLGGCILLIYPHCIKFSDNSQSSQFIHHPPVYRKKRVNVYFYVELYFRGSRFSKNLQVR